MITEPTVFIIGAGGNKPYGFPTGKELRELICKNYVDKFEQLFREKVRDEDYYEIETKIAENFVNQFYASNTESIDLFLSRKSDFSTSGRRAIIIEILAAEKKFIEEGKRFRSGDWYAYLFNRMTEDLRKSEDIKDILNNKVTFVTFNYDRYLEYFFANSIINSFSLNPSEAIQYIKKIPIYHIYGQTSYLPWQNSSYSVKFGQDFNLNLVDYIQQDIKIIYDFKKGISPEIQKCISEAKRIFFLGFSYLNENLELLKIPEGLIPGQKIYGTALGFLPEEIERTKHRLNGKYVSNFHKDMILEDCDCLTFLRKHLLPIEKT